MGPILGGMKQCKCMVILRDFPLIVHEAWIGNIMTPCFFVSSESSLASQPKPGNLLDLYVFFEERSDFLGSGINLGDTVDGSEILLTS